MIPIQQRFDQLFTRGFYLEISGSLMMILGSKICRMGVGKFDEVARLVITNFTHAFIANYSELNNGIASGLKAGSLSEAEAAEFAARSTSAENLDVFGRTIESLGTLTMCVGLGLIAYAAWEKRRDIHRLWANPPPAPAANPFRLPRLVTKTDTSAGG